MANVKALRELKKWILAQPRRYNQGTWIDVGGSLTLEQNPPCGTVACLAGSACLMQGHRPVKDGVTFFLTRRGYVSDCAFNLGKSILGLTELEARKLFDQDCDGWPAKAKAAYLGASTEIERAKAAAMAIDALIKKASR